MISIFKLWLFDVPFVLISLPVFLTVYRAKDLYLVLNGEQDISKKRIFCVISLLLILGDIAAMFASILVFLCILRITTFFRFVFVWKKREFSAFLRALKRETSRWKSQVPKNTEIFWSSAWGSLVLTFYDILNILEIFLIFLGVEIFLKNFETKFEIVFRSPKFYLTHV